MKKIVAVMLLALCLFSLFSCGSNDLKEYAKLVTEAEGSSATAEVTITDPNGDEVVNESVLYYEANSKKKQNPSLMIQYYTTFSFDAKGNAVMPSNTMDTMYAGSISQDAELVSLSSLKFDKKYFKDKKYEIDAKNNFSATIVNPSAFFGSSVGVSEVDITIKMGSDGPKNIVLKYETAEGYSVNIKVVYSYDE
jgi:hypothetical protein